MTNPSKTALLQLGLLVCFIGCCTANSAEPTIPSSNAEEVRTSVQSLHTSSLEPLRNITMIKGTNELQLVVPQGLGIDTSSPAKVIFASRDLMYWVSVRIIPPQPGSAGDNVASPDSNWVLANYSDANVTEETSVPTGEGDCKVFNFNWPLRGTGVTDRVGRIGLIRTTAGLVEFAMVAGSQQSRVASDDFLAVLRSFQTNRHGPIKRPALPDHS